MAKPLSEDLRNRVVGAVVREGLSFRAVAGRFGVGISAALYQPGYDLPLNFHPAAC